MNKIALFSLIRIGIWEGTKNFNLKSHDSGLFTYTVHGIFTVNGICVCTYMCIPYMFLNLENSERIFKEIPILV